jgi:hypothetical protein
MSLLYRHWSFEMLNVYFGILSDNIMSKNTHKAKNATVVFFMFYYFISTFLYVQMFLNPVVVFIVESGKEYTG